MKSFFRMSYPYCLWIGIFIVAPMLMIFLYAITNTGNSTLYASANGTTFTICNEHSEAKGGEQLRVQAIEITYAQ